MEIFWLGQAGLMICACDKTILVDPYLSNSVEAVNPKNYRRVAVCEKFLKIKPDYILLTHNHLDHTDPETLKHYLNESSHITVLASKNAWNEARSFGGDNNYVLFNSKTLWSQDGIVFEAVKAEHSDEFAIGIIIYAEGKVLYITGDTLYNKAIFDELPPHIDCLFLPINGVGNNMNLTDAEHFAEKVNAKATVPLHFGLFDTLDANAFNCKSKVIPTIYEKININL